MFEDLLEYTELHEANEELFMFGNVTFIRDFGPWKKGQKFTIVSFDLNAAEAIAYRDSENIDSKYTFKLV